MRLFKKNIVSLQLVKKCSDFATLFGTLRIRNFQSDRELMMNVRVSAGCLFYQRFPNTSTASNVKFAIFMQKKVS